MSAVPPPIRHDVVLTTRGRTVIRGAGLGALGLGGAGIACIFLVHPYGELAGACGLSFMAALLIMAAIRWRHPVRITLTGEGVRLDGLAAHEFIAWSDLRAIRVRPPIYGSYASTQISLLASDPAVPCRRIGWWSTRELRQEGILVSIPQALLGGSSIEHVLGLIRQRTNLPIEGL